MDLCTNSSKLILVGLYEGDLVAFRVVTDEQTPTQNRLQQFMLSHIHLGAIRTMRNCGSVVVSGGADGRVVVADLNEGTCWRVALPAEETVNTFDFSACGRYLFVGGAERSVFYVDLWMRAVKCTKKNVHKSQVQVVRVWPPTGRIMVTVGQDRSMRFWDLSKHRLSSSNNHLTLFRTDQRIEGPITCVEFNASGNLLLAAGTNFAHVTSVSDGQEVRAIALFGQKPCCAVWFGESLLVIGMISGWVVVLQTDDDRQPNWQRLHPSGKLAAMAGLDNYLATTTNTTEVTLWELRDVQFYKSCGATVAGRATSLVMVEVAKEVVEMAQDKEASPVVESDS